MTGPDAALRERALAALLEALPDVVEGILRLEDEVAPSLRAADRVARRQSLSTTLQAAVDALRLKDSDLLLKVVRDTVQLRTLGGVELRDLIVGSQAYLPVIRRELERAEGPLEGLLLFEAVEGELLFLATTALRGVLGDRLDPADEEWEDTLPGWQRGLPPSTSPFS